MRNAGVQQVVACAGFLLGIAFGAAQESPTKQPEREHTFPAILFTSTGKYPHELAAAFGDFTLAGPKTDLLKPLPKGICHVANDSKEKQLYGISNHEVFQVDLKKGTATALKLPADLSKKLSWLCGITFDTKRERVVLVSLGGIGYLCSYTPKTGQWALISDMNNLDLAGLTYDAKTDRLIGLYQSFGGNAPTVGVFNSNGALVDSFQLIDPITPIKLKAGPIERPIQLVPVGDELAVIREDRILVVDPRTEKVRVTWARK